MEIGKKYTIEYTITKDEIFKKVFQKAEIASNVIGDILGVEIDSNKVEYIDSVQTNGVNLKSETFDVTLVIEEERLSFVDLEMEGKRRMYNLADRLMINLASLISSHQKKGLEYGSNNFYSICFTAYPIEGEECIYTLFKEKEPKVGCSQIYIVDLTKIKNCDKLHLRNIMEALKSNDLVLNASDDEVVKMAKETILELNEDWILKNEIRLREKAERDRISHENGLKKEARAEGKAEGKAEGILYAVKSMYESGISTSDIARILRVDLSYVKEIVEK